MTIEANETAMKDSGRRGGRDARRQARASKLSDQDRPIWPGLPGGKYQVLSLSLIHISEPTRPY